MKIQISLSKEWVTVPRTQANARAFIAWYIGYEKDPVFKKAVKHLLDVKIGSAPSLKGLPSNMSIDVVTRILWISTGSVLGPDVLSAKDSIGPLRHELGHLVFHKIEKTPLAEAFAVEVIKALQQGNFITSYQEDLAERYEAKRITRARLIHESFAECARFSTDKMPWVPKVEAAFRKCWSAASSVL